MSINIIFNEGGANMEKNMLVGQMQGFLNSKSLDFSELDIEKLLKISPYVSELFTKIAESSKNKEAMEIFERVMSTYESELKRDDLTEEQRIAIYNRIDKHVKEANESSTESMRFRRGLAGTILMGALAIAGAKLIKK